MGILQKQGEVEESIDQQPSSMEESRKKEKEEDDDEAAAVNYRGIKAMPYIIGNETFEKLGTVGSASNLIVYLTTVFNMSSVSATTLINVFNGTCNLATLLGAFLCDTYFGRYNCLAFASVSSFLGMLVLMLTAAIPSLHPPQCPSGETNCSKATAPQFILLLSSFAFLVIGAGGIRPCNLTFGADQFNPVTESGRKGTNSFFNWYYFTYTFAVMVSVTGIVYIQSDVSWGIGLGIPALLMFLSCAVFFWGTSIYVIVKPQGSPLTSVFQVLAAASRKKRLKLPQNPQNSLFNFLPPKSLNSNLSHTTQFACLDKAAIATEQDEYKPDGSPKQPWRLCSLQQVEEVKCIARILPIWSTSILFHIAIMQQQTYGVFQALQSDRRLGNGGFRVPAATYIIFTMLALTLWIPIYDRIIVPYLEKITGKEGGITLLQRMGVGLVLGVLCMIASGLVEEYRKHIADTQPGIGIAPKGGDISAMSGMWLVPQLVLTGLAEGFNYIAQVEFYYKQFPESMRTIAQAFFFGGNALSSYLSGFLVSIVHQITSGGDGGGDWLPDDLNKGKLDYFYFMLAGLGIVNIGYFIMCAQWYVYKGELKSTGDDEIELPNKEPRKKMHLAV